MLAKKGLLILTFASLLRAVFKSSLNRKPALYIMRTPSATVSTHSSVVTILNQLFALESKINKLVESDGLLRNVDRIKEEFAAWGYTIENPWGQTFDETRTDCDASIAGESTENLVIVDVIKPLVRYRDEMGSIIAQRAVVVVRDSNNL